MIDVVVGLNQDGFRADFCCIDSDRGVIHPQTQHLTLGYPGSLVKTHDFGLPVSHLKFKAGEDW